MNKLQKLLSDAPFLNDILAALEAAGHQAHLVGGAVRNVMMGLPVKDYDIATNARPADVQSIFECADVQAMFKGQDVSVHPTGIEHGTLTVVVGGVPFEITTWRRDVATDGRRATVAFADDITDDAMRRDFTMNALYLSRDGAIIDPTGNGLVDLSMRQICFIGDADKRIEEDALRILRYFRFHARFDCEIDEQSDDFKACQRHAVAINALSRERIGMEMQAILSVQFPNRVLESMQRADLLQYILPSMPQEALGKVGTLQDAERKEGLPAYSVRRLALLCEAPPKAELAMSRQHVKEHAELSRWVRSDVSFAELGYRLREQALDGLALRAALTGAAATEASRSATLSGSLAVFPVKPADLIGQFQGPALGQALRDAEKHWIDSDFCFDLATILKGMGLEQSDR